MRRLQQHQRTVIVIVVVAAGIGSRCCRRAMIVCQLLLIVRRGHRMCMNIGESIAQSRCCRCGQMMALRRRRRTALGGSCEAVMTHIGIDQIHVGIGAGRGVYVVERGDALRCVNRIRSGYVCGQAMIEAGRQS